MNESRQTFADILAVPVNWLVLCVIAIMLVPILNVAPGLQTFMHPWRPELAASLTLIGFAVWAWRSGSFAGFVQHLGSKERYLILLPIALFILWSGLSAAWANSSASVLHHTTVWIAYLSFYVIFRFFTSNQERTAKIVVAAMCAIWLICLPPLIEYYGFVSEEYSSNIAGRYAKYAELANTLVPLIASISLTAGRRIRIFGFATVVLVWLFNIAGQRRAGIGIFAVSLALLLIATFILPKWREHRKPMLVLAAILLASTAAFGMLFTSFGGNVPLAERLGDRDTIHSTNIRLFLTDISVEMLEKNIVAGVGADNFGLEFDDYRRALMREQPNHDYPVVTEDRIAERAHNEFVQIAAELGLVGLGIFSIFLFGIAYAALDVLRRRGSASMVTVAAFIGVIGFLASSLVSSYSFRIFQNGLIFFLVLAIAIGRSEIPKADEKKGRWLLKLSSLVVIVSSLALAAYCVVRVAAVQTMINSGGDKSIEQKELNWASAIGLDPENAYFYSYIGQEYLKEKNFPSAAKYFRSTIDRGRATVMDYSYLATAERLRGDLPAARHVLEEGVGLYPRSVFLRARLGVVLKDLGESAAAGKQFEIANNVDPVQAVAWRIFIESGGVALSKAAVGGEVIDVMTLWPRNAIYAMQTEREARFPDEKYSGSF